jgi:hypothetical protein
MPHSVSCQRMSHALYKETKYLSGPTKVQLYKSGDTNSNTVTKALNLNLT